ncbi:MAG: TonB-dependent receptor, partial [Bacteroidota bacterium]|nr:TonB-dependent receptor [Bacteroidota bacterium]
HARYREGYFNYEDSYDQDRSLVFIERMFDNIQLLGEHSFKKLNNSKIKWQSSYAFMKQNEPDLRFFENLYDINGADTSFRTKTNDKPARYYRDISEINVSNRIDFEMPINFDLLKFKLQLGLSADFKNRDLNDVKFELFSPSTTIPNGDIVGYLKNDVISEDNYLGYFYSSDNYRNLNNSQSAYLRVLAGYIMFNFNLNDKCRLVSGFRVDKSILHTEDKLPLNHILKDDVTKDYLNILPSLNLSYSLKENMNFRFVYSKTLARPSFKEIGPSYYNFRNSELITGNLNLKISTINNVDLRWEYFFKQGEKISFSGFYKYFNKPIEKKLAVDVNNREFVYTNSEPIQLYGIELEFRKKLDFIVLLKDFILGGNFSLFKSEYKIPVEELASLRIGNPDRENTRPMQGQAPYIINSYLNYNNKRYKFDINVGFNVSGEKLVLITQNGTPYGYELARPALNCNLSKDIGNRLTVNFSIKNILDSEYAIVHHFNFEDRYYSKYTKGRLYAISFKMKINK